MVDANAVVPRIGYLSAANAPIASSAFSAKAAELRSMEIVAPGEFERGWLDCSACCSIIAEVAGLDRPSGYLTAMDVEETFTKAKWPSLKGMPMEPVPSEYAYIVISKAFVELCIQHRLAIEFS